MPVLVHLADYLVIAGQLPTAPKTPSPYLTAREAADYLNVSYGTFRNWATRIKRAKTGRYRREDLDQFASTRRK
jgi:excisionase family DNA binding protein